MYVKIIRTLIFLANFMPLKLSSLPQKTIRKKSVWFSNAFLFRSVTQAIKKIDPFFYMEHCLHFWRERKLGSSLYFILDRVHSKSFLHFNSRSLTTQASSFRSNIASLTNTNALPCFFFFSFPKMSPLKRQVWYHVKKG